MLTVSRSSTLLYRIVFLAILLHSHVICAQTEPSTIRLGEATTITFPSKPYSDINSLQDQYGVSNENGFFQARFIKSNFDYTIQYESPEKIEEFYRGYLNGLADGLNGEIKSAKFSKLKGYIYLDATINYLDKTTGVLMTSKSRSVTLMGKIYNVSYINSSVEFNNFAQACDDFLNSLVIVAKAKDEPKNPGGSLYDSEAKTTGEMVWRMFIAIFIILSIIVVAVYFSTRKSKSEKANEVKDL